MESGEVDQMAVTGPAKRIAADSWRVYANATTSDDGIADVEPLDTLRKLWLCLDLKVVDADDVGVGKFGGITAQLDIVVALVQVDLERLGLLAEVRRIGFELHTGVVAPDHEVVLVEVELYWESDVVDGESKVDVVVASMNDLDFPLNSVAGRVTSHLDGVVHVRIGEPKVVGRSPKQAIAAEGH